eukprot:CAMPEP_0198286122 /NCGR_PEP_ID=MMETSP1449-20131203/5267_1 /TAXON_ID=420275 /ORGANISM="Attheya septentrionalis, Strain CCMP2084" /LENGTH=635 /DNA_ID=CAMNT_0043983761 /DNA_START=282 /DNA_END=2186 /DNA_ORIENTATION=+
MAPLRQRIEHEDVERHPETPLCCTVLTTDETERPHQRHHHHHHDYDRQHQQYFGESVGYEAIYIPPTNDTPENENDIFLEFPYNAFLASPQTENHMHDIVDNDNDKKKEHGTPVGRPPLYNNHGAKRDVLVDLLLQKTTSRMVRGDAPTPVHDNTTGIYIPSPPRVKRLRPQHDEAASSPFSIFQAILKARSSSSSSNANCAFTSPCQMSSLGVVDEEEEENKEIFPLFPIPLCHGRSRRRRSDMFVSQNKSLFDDDDDIITNEIPEIPSLCSTEDSDESSTASIMMNQAPHDGGGQRIEQSLPKPPDDNPICSSTQNDEHMENTSSETAEQKDDAHLAFFLSPCLVEQDPALPLSCPDVSSSLSEPLRQWWGRIQRTSGMQLILAQHASRQVPMSTPITTTTTQPPDEIILPMNNPTSSVHGQINEKDEKVNSSTEWNIPKDFLMSPQMTEDMSLSSMGSISRNSSAEESDHCGTSLEVEDAIQYFTDFQVPLHHDGESELNLDDMKGDLESTLNVERIEKELLQLPGFSLGDISQDESFLENYLGPVIGELSSILREEFPSLEPDQPCGEVIMPSFVAGEGNNEVPTQAVALCSNTVNCDKFLAIPPQLGYIFSTCVPVAKWTLTNLLAREAW